MKDQHDRPDRAATKPWEHVQAGQGSATDPLAVRFVASLNEDRRLYAQDIAGSIAHARMLRKVGLLTGDELACIEQGLEAIRTEIVEQGADWPGWRLELEDVHMCLEAALIEKIGDAGRKLHTGRSRNDQVVLDLKLWIKDNDVSVRIKELIIAFVDLADREGRIVAPSYTHLQRAQPIVVGAELLAWVTAFERASHRCHWAWMPDMTNPLGSGAIAGSSLPLDRQVVSSELLPQLSTLAPNSIDATSSRDAAIDFVYGLTMVAMTLSRWAEQWIIYMTSEFGFLRISDIYTTGSSMMPQKRNPDMLELIRGRCGGVYGHLVALLTICKGLPVGYSRDLQEDKRHLFGAYDTVCECLQMAAAIVRSARWDESRIREHLAEGFLDATSLAEYLVVKGVPFRTAHQIVGRLVQRCRQEGKQQLSQLALDDFNAACGDRTVCEQDVYDWLGAENVVKRYQSLGNAGFSGFEHQLAEWKKRLQENVDPDGSPRPR